MKSALERKQEEEERLGQQLGAKRQELITLVKQVNDAKKKALESIERMKQAVETASNDYMEYINSLEILRVKTDKLNQDNVPS